MSEAKISVILPVYNPGEGIHKCIDCLRNQTMKEIEMIFVDDCGTDGAKDVIRAAAQEDARIILLENEKNMGAGRSRNRGIEAAHGEYLSFVDPDDYVSTDFCEILYTKALQADADIVKGTYRDVIDGKIREENEFYHLNDRIKAGLAAGRPLYALFTFQHSTAIYRREMIVSHKAKYGPSNYAEDAVFLLQACYAAKSIEFTDQAVYYYVSRAQSSVRELSPVRWQGEVASLKEMLSFIDAKKIFNREGYGYATVRILSAVDLQAYFAEKPELRELSTDMMQELRELITGLSYYRELMEGDIIIEAFVRLNQNLSSAPYGWQWQSLPYEAYRKRVKLWVDFLCSHPEYKRRSQYYLWRVFENAIVFDGWNNKTEKRKALKELRSLAKQLPDPQVLTEGFVSMRLFVDYGINMFDLRKSGLGEIIKGFIKRLRR